MEAAYRAGAVIAVLTLALALAARLLWMPASDINGAAVWRPQRNPQIASMLARWRQRRAPAHKCAGGYLSDRRRDTFWRYVEDPTTLKLADVAVANGSVYAVFTSRGVNRSARVPDRGWATAEWWFTFLEADGGGGWGSGDARRVRASTFGEDPHHHTLVAHAPLPTSLRNWSTSDALHVTIAAPSLGVEYAEAPFCLYPPDTPTYTLISCTQTLVDAKTRALFPEWVAYHAAEGFQHAYIYANGPPGPLAQALAPLVAVGHVTVIDWEWPPAFGYSFAFQQAQENSCLLRARGRASWVGLHDLDEFFQAMGPRAGGGGGSGIGNSTAALAPIGGGAGGRSSGSGNGTVDLQPIGRGAGGRGGGGGNGTAAFQPIGGGAGGRASGSGNITAGDKEAAGAAAGSGVRAFLEAACPPSAPCREAALRARCWFFALAVNTTEQAAADADAAHSRSPVLARFRGRDVAALVNQREKALAQPGLVQYWSVHAMAKGDGPMRTLDPATELRLVHYKVPDRRAYNVTDGSMAAAAPRTDALLADWMGSDWHPDPSVVGLKQLNGSALPQAAGGG